MGECNYCLLKKIKEVAEQMGKEVGKIFLCTQKVFP